MEANSQTRKVLSQLAPAANAHLGVCPVGSQRQGQHGKETARLETLSTQRSGAVTHTWGTFGQVAETRGAPTTCWMGMIVFLVDNRCKDAIKWFLERLAHCLAQIYQAQTES